jgi:acyl-CoA dehydrogenase
MAKNDSGPPGPAGATMFLAPMNAPGIHIERVLDTLDRFMAGGHAVDRLEGLRVPESAVLGEVGAGLRYAQVRLAAPTTSPSTVRGAAPPSANR